MNKYKFLPSPIDYSVSNDNRKRVVLGIGTATCEIEEKENE